MLRLKLALSVMIGLLCAPDYAHAQTEASDSYFTTKADYACIMDAETGLILYSKKAFEPMIPASMTKIMSAFMVFEEIAKGRISLDQPFRVSRNAWERGGSASGSSTSFLEPESEVPVQDLLRGMIVQSGNDAAITLAEGISGSEDAFARAMTKRAQELGLKSAYFTNASGLYSNKHRISAADLAELTRLMIKRFPELYKMFGEEYFSWNNIKQRNRNPLLGKFAGADGVKTGHLGISGYSIIASAIRGNTRRIIVLNGLPDRRSREEEARKTMRAALQDFRVRELIKTGSRVGEADVYLGRQTKVPLIVQKSHLVGLHVKAIEKMRAEIVYDGPLIAPIQAGQSIGNLVIGAPGMQNEITLPVIAERDVPRLSFLARAILGLTGAR